MDGGEINAAAGPVPSDRIDEMRDSRNLNTLLSSCINLVIVGADSAFIYSVGTASLVLTSGVAERGEGGH